MTTGLLLPPPPSTGPTIDGLVESDAPAEQRRYGVVDGRTLIGVQTIDIGRLQSHFIPIIPVGSSPLPDRGRTTRTSLARRRSRRSSRTPTATRSGTIAGRGLLRRPGCCSPR